MENSEEEKKPPLEGEKPTKRKMKTAGQLELLEKTYLSMFFFLSPVSSSVLLVSC